MVDSGVEVFVVLEGKVDLSAEKARLEKEIAAAQKELAGCEKTLANEALWPRPRLRWSRRRGTVQLSSRRSWRR